MRIYVDFDDVICETARDLSRLVQELYGRVVPYEAIATFNLREAFTLDEERYQTLMATAHSTERLLALQPTAGAIATLREWLEAGYEVEVVTGRPWATHDASREWLVRHDLPHLPLIHVDKYGREPPPAGNDTGERSLTLSEFLSRHYDVAIEDAPMALVLLRQMPGCRILLFDRPWNRTVVTQPPAITRYHNWEKIDLRALAR